MKKIMFSVLAAAALVACNNEETLKVQSPYAIEFADANVEGVTRAADDPSFNNNTNQVTGMNVWAFINEPDGTVLEGEKVQKGNGDWTYTNVQYWVPGDNTYYFAALAPMNSANWSLNTAGANHDGAGVVSFTNEDGSEDLLYAATSVAAPTAANQEMEAVKFEFSHLLSKVKFTFKNGFTTDNVHIIIKDIKMTAPKRGTIDLAVENWWDGNDWNLDGEFELGFGGVNKLDKGQADESTFERLTIPANADYNYTVSFTVEVLMGERSVEELELTSTISDVALEMGKAYNFTAEISPATLGLSEMEFDVTVKDWVETGDVALNYFVDENGNYVASSVEGLMQIAEEINNGIEPGRNILLGRDIDLAATRSIASNWTPIGNEDAVFEGELNGNGHTIKNLNLVYDEPAYYIGFFGCAQNATIKNVTFENVYVNVASDNSNEGGHIAGIAGYAQNTTFETVIVKGDVKIESTFENNASSRVAVIAGGNYGGKVTMKNVHVDANEGSYVKANNCVGALAGQLQGEVVFEDCSSNIDVIGYKFFAGGIIGLSAQKSTFTNCHTTGNVSIVAATSENNLHRVGGIAGGWADNKTAPVVLNNCSYTGTITGKDANGNEAETLDNLGYVGRGYSATKGTQVIIDGITFEYGNTTQATVSTVEELNAALNNADVKTIILGNGEFGTIVAKSNKTIIATASAKVDAVNLNGADNFTIKNINFDASTAVMSYDYVGNAKQYANIITGDKTNNSLKGAHNVVIDGCTFTGTFANGGTSIAFTDYNRKTGFSGNITIKNCTFDTKNAYYNIYGHYTGDGNNGYGDFVIENNTFKTVFAQGGAIYLGRYASSTPVMVKGNTFEVAKSLNEAMFVQDHSNYGVSIAAENNTFAE